MEPGKGGRAEFDNQLTITELEFHDYTQSRMYADQATDLSTKLNKDWARGKLFFRLAFLETLEGDYSEALKYDLQCINLYSENKDSIRLARALNDVGTDYRDLGQYGEGYFYLTQSYRIVRNHGNVPNHEDSLVMAIALHNIGTVFTELGQFESGVAARYMGNVVSVVFGGCMTLVVVVATWFKAPSLKKLEY